MKFSIAIMIGLLSASVAQAKIDVAARVSQGESTDAEATHLVKALKAQGIKGFFDKYGDERINLNGSITMTNGAICDNGHQTFSVRLRELNANGDQVQEIDLNNTNGCTNPSIAEKFAKLLDKWGGNTLAGDCGAGHCWAKIESIECSHYKGSGSLKAFDSCVVVMSSGQ